VAWLLTMIGMVSVLLTSCSAALTGPFPVSWLATEGNPSDSFIEFNENHYRAMLADVRRTQGYVEAIKQRLAQHPPGTMTVLDLGTGPFAVLAFAAAKAGAKKVYCIEANPKVAERARQEIKWAEGVIPEGTMEVIEGFSTDVSLPETVDLLVCEIAGSVASEEGMYATIRDAQQRFMKRPTDPASYIPFSYETWGAPCTDMVHHSGGADRSRKCTRVEADDSTLQLLADPQIVEDIRLADTTMPASGTIGAASSLVWTVDPHRVAANQEAFRQRLSKEGLPEEALPPLTEDISKSFSGIALWPRIVFDEAGTLIYESRGPKGEHQMSHWQTLVPLVGDRPVRIEPEDIVSANWEVELQDEKVMTPLKYSMECSVTAASESAEKLEEMLLAELTAALS